MFKFLRSVRSQMFFMLLIFGVLLIGTLTITLAVQLNSLKSQTRELLRTSLSYRYDTMVKAQVQQAVAALDHEWNKRADDAAGQEACRNLLRSLRYLDDESGYFWANDLQGNFVIHGSRPDLENTMALESVDSHGFKYIRELIRMGSQPGGGYTNYYFTKDNDKAHEYPKRSYSVLFKPTNWIIGTGNYIDDIARETDVYAAKLEGSFGQLQFDAVARTAVILLVLFFFFFIFSIRILDLVGKLNHALFEITQVGADLKTSLPAKGPTEMVEAANSFNEFIGSIRSILTSFSRDAHTVTEANAQIYAKLETLSEGLNAVSAKLRAMAKDGAAADAESLKAVARMVGEAEGLTDEITVAARKRNEIYATTTAELIRFKLED